MRIPRLAAVALAGLCACTAGCQLADFSSRWPARAKSADLVEELSDSQVADVKLGLARSMEQRREVEPSINAYREAVEKDPHKSLGYWRMAVLKDRQGNVQQSEQLYRQALKIDPKNADIHCDFGYSLYLQRRWAEAEEKLRHAIALKPGLARAHNNLGLVLAQTDRPDESVAEFRKAGCKEAEARANLAFVLTLNHCWDDAHAQYELALDANPSSAAAKSGLENLNALVAKSSNDADSVALASHELPVDAAAGPRGAAERRVAKRN
ncbi:MAG TPA: tetratricopeptide repeat protein [Planctomycetaceae bacterium]|jgi:Tfp pilus assembly protein PilF